MMSGLCEYVVHAGRVVHVRPGDARVGSQRQVLPAVVSGCAGVLVAVQLARRLDFSSVGEPGWPV
jgi:hypothetical protein